MATLTIELPAQVTQGQMMAMLETIGCELRLAKDGRNYTAVPRSKSQGSAMRHLKRIAADFREAWGHREGFVILMNGEPAGWKLHLDNPGAWSPGCIAIDEAGNMWVAAGGNTYDGAERWDPVGSDSNVVRMPARVRQVRQPTPPGAA